MIRIPINTNPFVLNILILLFIFSCKQRENSESSSLEIAMDSATINVIYSNACFSIPSPNQTSLLIKKNYLKFTPELITPVNKTENYATSFNKAIILGIWGADISYLNLYNQKELALPYFRNIYTLLNELEISKPFQPEFFTKMEDNFGNNDSLMSYISELYRRCDEYLKYNERNDIGCLIITGGWIESFYFLTNLYTKTKDKQIFALILYQKEIIDNLIKILGPYYYKTDEYKNLTDDLANLAYEFDVIDIENSTEKTYLDSIRQYTFVKNNTKFIISGSQLTNLATLSSQLRYKYIDQ